MISASLSLVVQEGKQAWGPGQAEWCPELVPQVPGLTPAQDMPSEGQERASSIQYGPKEAWKSTLQLWPSSHYPHHSLIPLFQQVEK